MSAVEDTRKARERANRLLAEIGNLRVFWHDQSRFCGSDDGTRPFPLADQDAVHELVLRKLAVVSGFPPGSDRSQPTPVLLTDKGRAVLGAPGASDLDEIDVALVAELKAQGGEDAARMLREYLTLPSPPPLLCDGVTHAQGEQPPAVVVVAETTGGMKRMVLCRDCGQRYALDAAGLTLAGFELDHCAPPVAIHLIPLPRHSGQPGASL